MEACKLFSIAALVALVTTERSVPSPKSPPVNVSSLNTANKDIYPANITIASGAEPDQLVHISAISDADWHKSVCRGRKLFLAMTGDSDQGTRYIDPLTTTWDGDLEEEMVSWGWDNWAQEDGWCHFNEQGLTPALEALGISDTSVEKEGENTCWSAFHYDGPGVLFDPYGPDYIDDSDDEMLARDDQYYMDPNGLEKRCTGAQYTFGINIPAGVLYFISRTGPLEAAKDLWKYTPKISELPDLRASSDLAWGIWNKLRGPDNLGDIRKMFSLYITNLETYAILERALGIESVGEVKKWPGTDFDAKSEAGLAILGSANGRAGGYLLAQHKRQLGGNKYISKMTVFECDKRDESHAIILFWIDDVPSPPPEIGEPDDENMDTGAGRVESKVVRRRDHGRSLTRQHVIWVE